MPNYAAAQQVSPTDSRIKAEYATVPSPQGNGSIRGYLVRPANAGTNRLPAILVVHENRGLNPHIEDVARRLALENFMAFAPDGLTSVGGYPGDDEKGGELFGKVDRAKMAEDLYAAAVWVKKRPDSTGRLGVTGFCFGGGVANSLAVRMGADLQAAVPYYGGAPPAADVAKIKAAVLVHHGGEDKRLVDAYPEYEAAMKAAESMDDVTTALSAQASLEREKALRRSAPAPAPSDDLEFADPDADDDEEESLDDALDDDDEVISAGGAIEEEEDIEPNTDGGADDNRKRTFDTQGVRAREGDENGRRQERSARDCSPPWEVS